jgi:FtsP/CotA-like multicopper oxidase with cupredoxin domain
MLNGNLSPTLRVALLATLAALPAGSARAAIQGVSGPSFTLTAKADRISTPDGGSFLFWGFTSGGGRPQYPGPTLMLDQGQSASVTVVNALPPETGQRVSLAFPGQQGVAATCTLAPCVQGAITLEAGPGGRVTYSFTASRPGTFLYNSASRPDLQIEMGLLGALIVRPTGFAQGAPDSHPDRRAYATSGSRYDQEYLFLLSEIDSRIHDAVERQGVAAVDEAGLLANVEPNYWFMNGRNAPDTMAEPGVSNLPTQPYNALAVTHPGDRVLMRVVGAGRDMHPFHHHGNHARVIARDGFLLQTASGDLDLSHEVFTIQSLPGQTVDAIFTWTGRDLGWDIYGDNPIEYAPGLFKPAQLAPAWAHTCTAGPGGLDPQSREYCPDHTKPIPVTLPDLMSQTFGGFWGGSPYLGSLALLPPGQGGLNPNAGFSYMWHSHTERELTNYDVFPGGMMTMLIVEPLAVPIP